MCTKIGCYRLLTRGRERSGVNTMQTRLGPTRLGSARLGSARLGSVRCDARPDAARRGTATLLSTARS